MKKLLSTLVAMALIAPMACAGFARADTILGSTTIPSGSAPGTCGTARVINQVTSDPSIPYAAPGNGTITQWQTNTTGSTPGSPVMLVALRPVGASFSVVGVDSRVLPTPAPSGGIATFPIASPIAVAAGDTLGLYANGSAVNCFYSGGATSLAATLAALGAPSPPGPGQTLSRLFGDSPAGFTMNLAANFAPAPPHKKKCKKKKKKRSAESAKKKKCKKKKKK